MILRLLVCALIGHRFEWDPTSSWVDYLDSGIVCRRCGFAPGLPARPRPLMLPPHATDRAERAASEAAANLEAE